MYQAFLCAQLHCSNELGKHGKLYNVVELGKMYLYTKVLEVASCMCEVHLPKICKAHCIVHNALK